MGGDFKGVGTQVKRCPACEETLPIENFSEDKHSHDGLRQYCRSCYPLVCRRSRQKILEKKFLSQGGHENPNNSIGLCECGDYYTCIICRKDYDTPIYKDLCGPCVKKRAKNGEKRCSQCGEVKSLEDFAINKGKSDGRHTFCRRCMTDYLRESKQKRLKKQYENSGLNDKGNRLGKCDCGRYYVAEWDNNLAPGHKLTVSCCHFCKEM